MIVELHDLEFAHLGWYTGYDQPNTITWDRKGKQSVAVFTERCLDEVDQCSAQITVAWLLEPRAIHLYGYDKILSGMHEKFDFILSFDREILDRFPGRAHWWTPGGSWVWLRDWQVYPKTANTSIIASVKNWTNGHRLRQTVIDRFGPRFDLVAGYGRTAIEPKAVGLAPYRYSVAIENSCVEWYWTDKLLDCFACGTVPIYWGCPDLQRFGFDPAGIIPWRTLDDLAVILDMIGAEDYERRLDAVRYNHEHAKKFAIPEDVMYERFFHMFDKGGA